MTWFEILVGMRYRGTCPDNVVDAAVTRQLISAAEAVLIKEIPNGGFPPVTVQPTPVEPAEEPAATVETADRETTD